MNGLSTDLANFRPRFVDCAKVNETRSQDFCQEKHHARVNRRHDGCFDGGTRKGLLAFELLNLGRETRLNSGSGVGMNHLLGSRLIEQLGSATELGFGCRDITSDNGGDNLFVLRANSTLPGTIPLAGDDTLFQSFSGTLNIRHGFRQKK
jgi:hypothetical protein